MERGTNSFFRIVDVTQKTLAAVSGVVLSLAMLLTVADVLMRYLFRMPIMGTYEIVGLMGAVTLGFSLPFASWTKTHVQADFLVMKLEEKERVLALLSTRAMGLVFFAILGTSLFTKGLKLCRNSEVTPTLMLPFYPVCCAVGICCFILCLVFVCDIVRITRGAHE